MESNLNDILQRINRKLNCFTSSPLSQPTLPPNWSNIPNSSNTSTNHLPEKPQGLLNGPRKFAKISQHNTSIMEQSKRQAGSKQNNACNQEDQRTLKNSEHREAFDKNLNQKNSCTNFHEQNYLSLRKRNKALENDVKRLQQRLQIIQKSLPKEDKLLSTSGNTNQTIKMKKIYNKCSSQSHLQKKVPFVDNKPMKKASCSKDSMKSKDKSFNIVSTHKYEESFKNIIKNFQRNSNEIYGEKNVLKKEQNNGAACEGSSMKLRTENKKLGKGVKLKNSLETSKILVRCKSSQALNQEEQNKNQMKHSKSGSKRSGEKWSSLIRSQQNLQSPGKKEDLIRDQARLDKKQIQNKSKLNKVGIRRPIKCG